MTKHWNGRAPTAVPVTTREIFCRRTTDPFFFRPMPAAASFVPKGTVGLAPDDDVVVVMVFDDVTDKRSNHIDDHLSWCVSNEADRMDDERKNGIYFTPNNDLRGYSL